MLQKGWVFGSEMGNFFTEMGNKYSNLPLTPGCRTSFWGARYEGFAVFGMCEGERSWVQLKSQVSKSCSLSPHSWSGLCWAEQHTRAIDQLRLPSYTDVLWEFLVPWEPSLLFFLFVVVLVAVFLSASFSFFFFSLFWGRWRKFNETMELPNCSPSSLPFLCCKRTHHPLVLNWHWLEQWLCKSRSSKSLRKSKLWSVTQHHRWCGITESGTALFGQGLPLISNLAKQNKTKQKSPWSISFFFLMLESLIVAVWWCAMQIKAVKKQS